MSSARSSSRRYAIYTDYRETSKHCFIHNYVGMYDFICIYVQFVVIFCSMPNEKVDSQCIAGENSLRIVLTSK